MQLFIGNIPHSATRDEIRVHCETIGPLYALQIPPSKIEGSRNPGYAFAMFRSRVAAAEAIEQLAGSSLPQAPGRKLVRHAALATSVAACSRPACRGLCPSRAKCKESLSQRLLAVVTAESSLGLGVSVRGAL